jgi:hypothetical protein
MADPVGIPARLQGRPVVGGVVIPWVTVVLADGSPDWRACIRGRVTASIQQGRCQLDGQRIDGVAVFFVANDQMPADAGQQIVTDVPPVHPECAQYAVKVCPMLNGRNRTYADRERRSATSPHNRCDRPGCDCGGYVSVETRDMGGHAVTGWQAVWATRWAMTLAPDGAPFAVISEVRRIRAVQATSDTRSYPSEAP